MPSSASENHFSNIASWDLKAQRVFLTLLFSCYNKGEILFVALMEPGPWLAGGNQHSSYFRHTDFPRTGVYYRGSRWEKHLLKAILLMQMKADGISTAENTNLWRASEHPVSFNDSFNALVVLPFSHNSIALNMQEAYCVQRRVFLRSLLSNNLSWLSSLFSAVTIFERQRSRRKITNFTRIHMGFETLMWLLCYSGFFFRQ